MPRRHLGPMRTGIRVTDVRCLASGNPLGGVPAIALRICQNGPLPDDGQVHAILAELDAGMAAEFPMVDVTAGAGAGSMVARVVAALLACGRDLAAAVRPQTDGSEWVLVELDRAVEPGPVAVAAMAVVAAAEGGDAAAARLAVGEIRRSAAARMEELDRLWAARALERHGHPGRPAWLPGARRVGEGRRSRVYEISITPGTPYVGAALVERKHHAQTLLARLGLPVPRHLRAEDRAAAVAAAEAIGYPVVVKPTGGSNARGVAVGVAGSAEVRAAFDAAAAHRSGVVVEALLPGADHRLLVIGGRLAAATRRSPAAVTGDGRRTVEALLAAANADPRRGGPRAVLMPIRCDAEAVRLLARQGLDLGSVPDRGRTVALAATGNHGAGSTPVDVTAMVHPDNRKAACQAVAAFGLDVAGVDFICPDIARSWREVGGGICEVNRQPGLVPHMLQGHSGSDPSAAFAAHLVSGSGRVPIVAVVGDERADGPVRAVAAALAALGCIVGTATGDGLTAAGLPLADPGPGRPERIARLVNDPLVGVVVAAVAPAAILSAGFGHGRADLAILVDADDPAVAEAAAILALIGARTMRWPQSGDPDAAAMDAARSAAALTCAAAGR